MQALIDLKNEMIAHPKFAGSSTKISVCFSAALVKQRPFFDKLALFLGFYENKQARYDEGDPAKAALFDAVCGKVLEFVKESVKNETIIPQALMYIAIYKRDIIELLNGVMDQKKDARGILLRVFLSIVTAVRIEDENGEEDMEIQDYIDQRLISESGGQSELE